MIRLNKGLSVRKGKGPSYWAASYWVLGFRVIRHLDPSSPGSGGKGYRF